MQNSLNTGSLSKAFDEVFKEIFGSNYPDIFPVVPTDAESKGDLFDRRMPMVGNDISSKLVITDSEN